MRRALLCIPLLLSSTAAFAVAPGEQPAVSDDQPAVQTDIPERPRSNPTVSAPNATAPGPSAPVQASGGTQVIGEQESPIGLYIMPWRQSAAQGGLDRPARLLDDRLLPLDPDVFRRQVQYHRALSEHLEQQGKITPDSR